MSDDRSLATRVRVAEATGEKFAGRPFEWGERDCLRMVAFALREFGYAPPLRAAGSYRTLIGAHRALKRTGFATLDAWIDAWGLQRIPPASALPADVLALPSEIPSMPALGLNLSGGYFLCFVPATGAAECVAFANGDQPLAAWRA